MIVCFVVACALQLSFPSKAVVFGDCVATAKQIARDLRDAQQCDIVVALTHTGFDEDKRVALEADVDLVVGGHDHTPIMTIEGRTLVLKPGMNARWLGIVDVELASSTTATTTTQKRAAPSMSWSMRHVRDATTPPSTALGRDVATIVNRFAEQVFLFLFLFFFFWSFRFFIC